MKETEHEENNQRKYQQFVLDEARWLDSEVRKFIPRWVQWVVEKNAKNFIGKVGHFLVDHVLISLILRIEIKRNQDTEILGGSGFRPNVDHGYKILAVRTKVLRAGKEIAERRFPLNMIIKTSV